MEPLGHENLAINIASKWQYFKNVGNLNNKIIIDKGKARPSFNKYGKYVIISTAAWQHRPADNSTQLCTSTAVPLWGREHHLRISLKMLGRQLQGARPSR